MLPYPFLCAVLGLALGWVPSKLHGPIPYKYNILGMNGGLAVWAWYVARSLIGFLVGITAWSRPLWLRGPLVGFLTILPLGFVSLSTPGCGAPCMFWNEFTGTWIGLIVGGVAYALTRRHHMA